MKLYITPGSPYARMARIVVLEKGLESRVETIAAKTRVADSPYYGINPSGRVPYLVCGDGIGLEESALICAYLDHLDGNPVFDLPTDDQSWEARRLEALARSMLDGLAVWGREIMRPENERSPGVIQHETDRARRLADTWEREINHPLMRGPLKRERQCQHPKPENDEIPDNFSEHLRKPGAGVRVCREPGQPAEVGAGLCKVDS